MTRETQPIPFLERGFRPFFLGASLFAGIAIPVWALMLSQGWAPSGYLQAQQWHVHEMIFGFVPAVIAGFLLTAIPNWTGRPPVAGTLLLALFALWITGRLAMAFLGSAPLVSAGIAAAFPICLTLIIAREILASKNWHNLPVLLAVGVIAFANSAFHFALLSDHHTAFSVRLGLSAIAVYLLLIGGRVTPNFTRNWMKQNGVEALPAPAGLADTIGIIAPVLSLAVWTVLGDQPVSGALFIVGALAIFARLMRWHGWRTIKEPIVAILHIGYLWIAVWFALMALAILTDMMPLTSALHGLTSGAIGTMTLAIMSRASLGHSGLPIKAGGFLIMVYSLMMIGAVLRISASFLPGDYTVLVGVAGLMWGAAYLMFAIGFAPLFFRARKSDEA